MGSEAPSGPSAPRTEVELSDTALICGWWFPPDAPAVPVGAAGLALAFFIHGVVPVGGVFRVAWGQAVGRPA